MTGGRGVRLRAISIVTCWRVHVQGYRVYEAHEYHSPRPFMLPIIIEKERRNRARPPGKLASSMPYAFHRRIPTTGGSFYRAVLAPPSWRTTNKEPVTYIQFPLLLAPTALFVQGNRFPSLLEKHHYHWSSFLLHI